MSKPIIKNKDSELSSRSSRNGFSRSCYINNEPRYFKEYLNYLLAVRNLSPRTIKNYYVSIRTFLRWVCCRDAGSMTSDLSEVDILPLPAEVVFALTTEDIQEFLSYCANMLDNDAAQRANKLSAIKSFYGYHTDVRRSLEVNPAEPIKNPKMEKKLPRYLTLEESRKLLSSVKGDAASRDFCIIFWLLNCGMRLSELVGIDLDDISEDKLRIYGKGRKERVIYLNPSCLTALDEYLTERQSYARSKDEERALFISARTGKRISARRVEQIVEHYLMEAGLSGKGISPHKLRHTAATLLYTSGAADILQLKEILGHTSTAVTEIYTHLSPESIKGAMNLNPLANDKV